MKRTGKRWGQFAALIMLAAFCSSCYQHDRRAEKLMTRAIEQFHEQLNDERYHDIYVHGDAELRSRVNEAEFTAQLASAHARMGRITSQPRVYLQDSAVRTLRQAFGLKRNLIPDYQFSSSETAMGDERFLSAVEDDQVNLAAYEFRLVCSKPCQLGGFGPGK